MKQKILYIVFGISLGINVSLLGAMAYWLTRPEKVPGVPVWERPFAQLPPSLRAKLHESRKEDMPEFRRIGKALGDAHNRLYRQLRQDPADEQQIQETMKEIVDLQSRLQSLVVQRILKDSKGLDPDEREQYFDAIRHRFLHMGRFCPGFGPPAQHGWKGPGQAVMVPPEPGP